MSTANVTIHLRVNEDSKQTVCGAPLEEVPDKLGVKIKLCPYCHMAVNDHGP